MATLNGLGTEQNRKIYRKHGAVGDLFGVSFADLAKLAKKLKRNHALAQQLWDTGNYDARNLATMIAEPAQMDTAALNAWATGLNSHGHADLFARNVASSSPSGAACMKDWMNSSTDFVSQCGWDLLAMRAMNEAVLPDSYFEAFLETIESGIHAGQNRTRHAMNMALIATGMRNPALRAKAEAAAKRMGRVEVDHGDTNCKTPDAVAYIAKALAYKAKKTTSRKT
ncbi:MAG: DNA alkylation repair protein [Bryobacteraceae bacterium]